MKKIEVDKQKRKALIKNFKALAFLSCLLLPFSLNAKTKNIISKPDNPSPAVWG